MSALPVVTTPRRRRAEEARELCVVLGCHHLICALPTSWVDRLVLPDEVTVEAQDASAAPGRSWQVIRAGEKRYAACNLGTLFGLPPLDAAWVLMRVPHRGFELPVALQTGACLVVQHLPPGLALPPGAFRARAGAISAVFPTNLLKTRAALNEVGIWLDPLRLWETAELDAAAAWLDASAKATA